MRKASYVSLQSALAYYGMIPEHVLSEDLDFSKVFAASLPDFRNSVARIKTGFEAEGYSVSLAVKSDKTVASAFVEFPGLLHDLGLSPHPSQILSIRVEVDTNPPAGAVLDTTL